MDNTQHDKMHWTCCWKPMLGVALWVVGLLSFLGGLLALWMGGAFLDVTVMTWYWTALVSGVLAAAKSKGNHGCGGGCGGGVCK